MFNILNIWEVLVKLEAIPSDNGESNPGTYHRPFALLTQGARAGDRHLLMKTKAIHH